MDCGFARWPVRSDSNTKPQDSYGKSTDVTDTCAVIEFLVDASSAHVQRSRPTYPIARELQLKALLITCSRALPSALRF